MVMNIMSCIWRRLLYSSISLRSRTALIMFKNAEESLNIYCMIKQVQRATAPLARKSFLVTIPLRVERTYIKK